MTRSRDVDAARRLAAIVESSDDAIIGRALDGTITSWNRAAERMFGWLAADAIGRPGSLIVPEHLMGEYDEVQAQVAAGMPVERRETLRRRKDGRLIPVALTVSPIYDEVGRTAGVSTIARDITVQQRAAARQALLIAVGEQFAGALDLATTLKRIVRLAIPEFADWCFLYLVDRHGSLERTEVGFADPAWAPLADRLRAFPPASPPEPVGPVKPTLLRDVGEELITAIQRSDEHGALIREIAPRSILSVPIGARGEWIAALTFMYTAGSDRRYDDSDLAWATDVAHRATAAIERARLYEQLERANRMKDEFLATLSHELRTPLNAIVGYARMLRRNVLGEEGRQRAIDVLERNAGTLTQLVSDVLDVSRIVSGKLRLDVQPVDLARVAASAVEALQPAADAKELRVRVDADPRAGRVSGDADRLQQICWNLLANAVKFTPKGGRVDVQLVDAGAHVDFVVRDSGIGIAPDFLPFVFDRFRQADSRPSREYGGLGLGLAIVRHLVELHGGTAEAASGGPGQGSTFLVRLPVLAAKPSEGQEPLPQRDAAAGAPEPLGPALGGIRVLAVDDEPDSLVLVADVLRAAGATVTCAGSARGALEFFEAEPADVIVADIGMPQMDGYTLMREIRARESAAGRLPTPSAALTAFARAEDRTQAIVAGFTTHLAKPIDPGGLVAAVEALVRRRAVEGG